MLLHLLLSVVLSVFTFHIHAEMSEKEVIDDVEREVGIVIDRNNAEEAYRVFEHLFEKLSNAQSSMVESKSVSMNKFYLLSTPMVNAFVIPQKDVGKDRIYNRVFITTGLIRHMMNFSKFDFENKNYLNDPELQKEIKYGILRVVGVIAHELAHPLDNVQHDKISIHDHYSRQASQAIEIRADLEGAKITENAGFSVDAVYLGLSRLFGKDSANGMIGAVETAFSTHPSSFVRLSSQKLYLTFNRYETGLKTTDTPVDIDDIRLEDFVTQVYNFKEYYKKYEYTPPKTLEEAVKRLEYNFYKNQDAYLSIIESNRLMLSIDKMLYEGEYKASNEYLKRYFDVLYQISLPENRNKFPIFTAKDLHFHLTTPEMSESIDTMKPHSWYLKNVKYFNDKRYVSSYLSRYKNISSINIYVNGITNFAGYFLSDDLTYKLLKNRLITHLKDNEYSKETTILEGLETKPASATYKHKIFMDIYNYWFKGKSHEKLVNRLLFFKDSNMGTLPIISDFAVNHQNHAYYRFYNYILIKAKNGDKDAQKHVENYKSIMQDIVDNSKFWMAFELVGKRYIVDWRYIAKVLEIKEDVLISRIHNQAHQLIREHAKNKKNSELYKYFSIIKKEINKSDYLKFKFEDVDNKKNIQWLNNSTLNLLKFNAESFSLFKNDFFKPQINTLVYDSKFKKPKEYIDDYKQKVKENLPAKDFNPFDINLKVYQQFFGNKKVHITIPDGALAISQFKALEEVSYDSKIIKKWLKLFYMTNNYHENFAEQYYLENYKNEFEGKALKEYQLKSFSLENMSNEISDVWFAKYEKKEFLEVINFLFKYKLVKNYYSLILKLEKRLINSNSYYKFLVKIHKEIVAEIKTEKGNSKDRLLEWAKVVSPSGYIKGGMDKSSYQNSYQLRDIKKALFNKANKNPMDLKSNYRMFLLLTNSGATIESDVFFEKHLKQHLSKKQIERVLENSRLHSKNMVFELAHEILMPELDDIISKKLEKSMLNPFIHRFLFKLNNLTKSDSFAKDKLLEELAWRLQLEGVRLSNFIEDEKSYNWRKANPSLVNLSSLMAELISGMRLETRYNFIEFLRDPDTKPDLLDKITNEIYKSSYSKFIAEAKLDPNKVDPKIKNKAYEFSQQARAQIESYVYNSSTTERMPIYELILSAGKDSIQNSNAYPLSFIRRSLNFEKSSKDEKMLLTFLEMIPEHERTVSLAYLLSQSGEDKSDVKQLFKVFQSVGIKFGQLASIWNIFDEEINRQIRELKDDAGAMDKLQVIKAVRSYLPKKEFEKIKSWKQVLGSASIKTVVEIEMFDGEKLALLVQNPNAEVQIKSNITLSERFIEGLKKRGVTSSSALFEGLVGALKEQIFDEIRFDLEAEMIKKASLAFSKVSKTMNMNGWKFHVPEVSTNLKSTDRIMALELVQGQTFDKIPEEYKAEVGRIITESSLHMLFTHGLFDPDRHKGNQMIDVKNKVIYPIDFGQMQQFSKTSAFTMDDRLILARFIESVGEKRIGLMIEMALKMTDTKQLFDKKQLHSDIERVLTTHTQSSEVITELVEVFSAHGLKFNKKFMFGGLKGLIILAGENYVSQQEFESILKAQIKKLYIQKWPLVLDSIYATFAQKIKSLFYPKPTKTATKLKMLEITRSQLDQAKLRAKNKVITCKSLF